MKCIFAHGFINALYWKFQHALFVRFSKTGSAGSDSNCKRLLVYCVSVMDASPKTLNSDSSWHQQATSSTLLATRYSLLYSKQSRHIKHSSFLAGWVVSTAYYRLARYSVEYTFYSRKICERVRHCNWAVLYKMFTYMIS